jgi:hypothetical protein
MLFYTKRLSTFGFIHQVYFIFTGFNILKNVLLTLHVKNVLLPQAHYDEDSSRSGDDRNPPVAIRHSIIMPSELQL